MVLLAAVLAAPLPRGKKPLRPRHKALLLIEGFLNLAIRKPGYAPAGQDPSALLLRWKNLSPLKELLDAVGSLDKGVSAAYQRELADIWKAVLVIFKIASAQAGGDPEVAQLVAQMEAAMATGPKAQKSVHSAIKPTPVKGSAVKRAMLAGARAEAGIPQPSGVPVVSAHPVAVVASVPTPAPAPSSTPSGGAGNGSVPGSGH